jgi:PIF1-like helicase
VASTGDAIWPEGIRPTDAFLATLDFVKNTRDNLFVTGRAGTGKSTLLRGIVRALDSQLVIAAPTGIAALNVGGETLHSLFRLPQGLLLDGEEERSSPRNIFEVDDLTLVIDEVSMVRSDVLNAIDFALRQQREIQALLGASASSPLATRINCPLSLTALRTKGSRTPSAGHFSFMRPRRAP